MRIGMLVAALAGCTEEPAVTISMTSEGVGIEVFDGTCPVPRVPAVTCSDAGSGDVWVDGDPTPPGRGECPVCSDARVSLLIGGEVVLTGGRGISYAGDARGGLVRIEGCGDTTTEIELPSTVPVKPIVTATVTDSNIDIMWDTPDDISWFHITNIHGFTIATCVAAGDTRSTRSPYSAQYPGRIIVWANQFEERASPLGPVFINARASGVPEPEMP